MLDRRTLYRIAVIFACLLLPGGELAGAGFGWRVIHCDDPCHFDREEEGDEEAGGEIDGEQGKCFAYHHKIQYDQEAHGL